MFGKIVKTLKPFELSSRQNSTCHLVGGEGSLAARRNQDGLCFAFIVDPIRLVRMQIAACRLRIAIVLADPAAAKTPTSPDPFAGGETKERHSTVANPFDPAYVIA